MCYSSTDMNQGRTSRRPEDQHQWQGIYPDIASFFAANTEAQQLQQQGMGQQNNNNTHNNNSGVAPMVLLLQQLLGLTPEQPQPGQGGHQQETPSAPPPPPSTPPSPTPTPAQEWQQTGHQQPCEHCGGRGTAPRPASCSQQWAEWKRQHPELAAAAPELVARCRSFAAAASRATAAVTLVAVLLAVLVLLPSSLGTGLAVLLLAPRLGLHLPTLLTGCCLLSWLSWCSPFSHLLVLLLLFRQWAHPGVQGVPRSNRN